MLDGGQDGPLVVRGIPVPRKPNGHHMCPARIKAVAAERFMAGQTVAAIAREVSANGSLAGKWIRDHKRADPDGGLPSGAVEIVAVVDERGATPGAAARMGDLRPPPR